MSKQQQRQKADACQRLIELGGHFGRVWFVNGPNAEFKEKIRTDNPDGYKGEAHLLARIALDLWDGQGRVRVLDLGELSARNLKSVTALIGTGFRRTLLSMWLLDNDPRQTSFKGDGYRAIQS